jgi:hypothetical protein
MDNQSSLATGAVCSLTGMSAYYLPVTKNRFVRNAYSILKNDTEEQIENFNDAAKDILSGGLKKESKIMLAQNRVGETFDAINNKVNDLKKVLTDRDTIKNIKTDFANNFENYKTSEALMDNVASRAFKKIRWTNFAWGAGIMFIVGLALGTKNKQNIDNIK